MITQSRFYIVQANIGPGKDYRLFELHLSSFDDFG